MEEITLDKKIILGLQHVLAMFGATVLVPMLTGLNPAVALLSAGVGTLIFHACTKGIVPVFLGSSFAFITAIQLTLATHGMAAVKGGIIAAGIIYILMGGIIKLVGVEVIQSFFPPIVIGPVIMIIGLRLSGTAFEMIGYTRIGETNMFTIPLKGILVAATVVITMVIVSIYAKGFFKLVPILMAVVTGYLLAWALGMVDTSIITKANWLGYSAAARSDLFTMPRFSLESIIAIAPIALVVFIEHIGDITTNGTVVGKNFFENPGVHRTLLGDGLATIAAGLLGGPANTTYGENTGVLAVTKVYDPGVIRIAAIIAILLSGVGKFGGLVQAIPDPVMGGVSIILFGMIASIGVRMLVENQVDFSVSRNMLIASIILVTGIGVDNIQIVGTITISGLAIAALIGIVLNKIIPEHI
ncbi:MAG TPA: uracil-xanthine permease [Epulopiscium sp.]|nr:uracil-xanthine permease [Candidatus Epulonipiscium sp.]